MTLVSVIIPSRDRTDSLLRAIDSIRATQGSHEPEIVVVLDEPDRASQQALADRPDVKVVVVPTDYLGRPQDKFNVGLEAATGEWIVAFADDCEMVSDGWIDACLAANVGGFVGLYDGVNDPGHFASLLMASRSYIDTVMDGYLGLPWYRHCMADVEWAERAREQGAYVVCFGARFKHYHPALMTGPSDALYQSGASWNAVDRETFARRKAEGWPKDVS